ncbi:sugar-binding protein [Gardnerella greenwoodii]|uniref:sugar-binding protein n=1 Tax=Gardnerella greenwoodii TaxID=2914925 RepID=UPI0039F06E9F
MKKNNINANSFADLLKSAKSTSYAPLSKSVCAAMLAGAMVLGGGVFVSPAPAYADGYVSPDGNNIYYGYKSDADYSKDRIKIEVHYYSNMKDAEDDTIANQDPLGKFVHVKYTANLNSSDNSFDKWAFRPMWWYGVPAGLTDVHDINYSRFEKYTGDGNPVPSRPGLHREDENVTKHYANSKDWKGISNFYITDPHELTSMNGLKTLLGIDGNKNNGYDNKGNTAGNWSDYYDATKGMQGMFVDWESAGKRFYQMTYVAELTEQAWKERNEHPLRFAAGVYRFAGNWHIATGQTHHAPKIADSLKVKYPALTPVAKADDLKDNEKTSVEKAIKTANKDVKYFNELLDKIEVAKDGTATLTFHDKTTITMPGKLLVVEDKKDNVKFPPVYPAPIGVVKPKSLSEADQKAIIQGFKDANKGKEFLDKVSKTDSEAYKFDNAKQELTITYTDGSTITVPYSSLVYQGAKISDWAPYVVPDPIEVTDPSKLSEAEQKKVTDAFDTANADLDVYTAAKKNNQTPVSFDNGFKNAIITWADGSTSTIPSWQFLKEKEKTAPAPEPSTPVAEEKTFIVDVPPTQTVVKFDPFKTTSEEINAGNAKTQLDSLKTVLAKYVKDSATKQKVDGVTVTYSVDNNGVGQVTFSKQGYTSKTYPMGIFFKNSPQSPASKPTTESKTHTDTTDQKNTFTYNVTKIEYDGEKPTAQDAAKALKQFVKDNYDNVSDSDLQHVTSEVAVGANWKPKANTKNMGSYDASGSNYGPMMSFSIAGNDFGIKVHGRPWDPDADNGPDWNSSMDMDLFTIKPDELYVKKAGAQHQDNTLADLKKQAKALLKQKRETDKLSDNDLTRAGIKDADKLNDNTIDSMNEKALRELIHKLIEATKAEYKYNTDLYEVDAEPTAAKPDVDFQNAVKKFLHVNYDDSSASDKIDNLTFDANSATLTGKGWTPKAGTSCLELKSDSATYGITTVSMGNDGAGADFKNGDKVLFTVPADKLYKKKAESKPAPSEDLEKLRKQAKEIIDRNPKLTEEQKEDFKNQIDKADTKDKIQNILKKANEQAGNNNVKPGDIKKKEKEEKEKREEEKRKKEQQNKLAEDKTKAKEALKKLTNLTDGESGDKKKLSDEIDNAQTSEDVKNIIEKAKAINDARGALKEGALPFLSHGNANSDDDKALKELIGADPSKKDETLTALENAIKDISSAQTSNIRAALEAAKRQNGINEQAAKRAATAKLDALEQSLEDAYNKLSDTDKTAVNAQYTAAKDAITQAKTAVTNATKPSDLLKAINGVNDSLTTANKAVKEKIDAEHNNNKKGNDHSSDPKELQKEKDKAKNDIDTIPGLTPDEKKKYKDEIDDSTHSGDPEAVVNRAKKNQKIKDALAAIDKLEHLNNAQKKAYEDIINSTDAHNIKDDDGKDTGKDDIDNALADAIATDHAMERLEKLKEIADTFANGEKYKSLQDSDDKKKAFNTASTAAGAVLAKETGDAKNADQVNDLYKDLLNAMQAIDNTVKGAGVNTDALQAEVDKDSKLKPTQADPSDSTKPGTPGDPIYNTSSQEKKQAFDQALTDAENALKTAKDDNANQQDPNATPRTPEQEAAAQKAVDEALKNLQKAREELDGVNTKPLQDEIGKDSTVNTLDRYTYSTKEKKDAFDQALQEAKDLIDKLTGKKQAGTDDHLDTKENKQKALDKALAKLKAAEEALKGKKPIEPTPTPTPTPSVDKSHLQQGINDGSDVHNSDEYNNAPSDKKQAYDHALDHANEVNNDPNATQDQVNQAAEDLKKAENDLKPTPSPLPTPIPGGHEDSGFGVNDNAPTTVDKGELNVQIDSAEADSQPGNAGAGNAGNTNAGAGANSGNAANAANSAAVNAAVENSPAVKQADAQVAKAQAALDSALAEAKKVAADPNATQAQVDAATQKLSAARKALAAAKSHAAQVRASVRAQVLKSGVSQLSKTGSNVSVIGLLATVAAAGAAFFVSKRRGISRHSNN